MQVNQKPWDNSFDSYVPAMVLNKHVYSVACTIYICIH